MFAYPRACLCTLQRWVAMSLVGNTCDTLELVAKVCPSQPTANLRRNLLSDMPAPYPAPAPMDPPAPAEGHVRIAPAPEDRYGATDLYFTR